MSNLAAAALCKTIQYGEVHKNCVTPMLEDLLIRHCELRAS